MFVGQAHELMQGERDFVRMRCTPNNDAIKLECIVGNGADFHQLGFDDLRVSHSNFSIAQIPRAARLLCDETGTRVTF